MSVVAPLMSTEKWHFAEKGQSLLKKPIETANFAFF
jgi:hypothetical protein